MPLFVEILSESAILPSVAHPGEDLGFDLYALNSVDLLPGKVTMVSTGIAALFVSDTNPEEKWGFLYRDRSSMASKGIAVSGGVIDAGYTNELRVLLTNHTETAYQINAGDRIVQMIPQQVQTNTEIKKVDKLPSSSRGEKGFGSSGR